MKLENIKTIAIAGAGTMGQGIAQICAMAGFKTILFDIKADMLEVAKTNIAKNLSKGVERRKVTEDQKESALSNISYTDNIKDMICDVAVEAVLENLDIKHQLFHTLEDINSENTIFGLYDNIFIQLLHTINRLLYKSLEWIFNCFFVTFSIFIKPFFIIVFL